MEQGRGRCAHFVERGDEPFPNARPTYGYNVSSFVFTEPVNPAQHGIIHHRRAVQFRIIVKETDQRPAGGVVVDVFDQRSRLCSEPSRSDN
jgi:hypothetical protein